MISLTWSTRFFWLSILACLSAVVWSSEVAVAQDDEARAGLVTRLSNGNSEVSRIDTKPGFDWSVERPDPRLKNPVEIRWSGTLLARLAGPHTFHAELTGHCLILIDGQRVLEGAGSNVFLSGEPLELTGGDHKIDVIYRSPTGESDLDRPRLAVFWSSPSFTLEPIPADALSHLPAELDGDAANRVKDPHSISRGRWLTDALRCGACHQGMSEASILSAPDLRTSLKQTGDRLILEKILSQPVSAMPHFSLTDEQAADVVAFLRTQVPYEDSGQGKNEALPGKPADGDLEAGQKLVTTLGCAACHRVPGLAFEQSADSVFAVEQNPDLRTVSHWRSRRWLALWLTKPEALNPEHRMPRYDLSDDEVRQIVLALTSEPSEAAARETDASAAMTVEQARTLVRDADPVKGKQWVEQARCASCHQVPGVSSPKLLPRPSDPDVLLSERSCLQSSENKDEAGTKVHGKSIMQPQYQLRRHDREAVAAWISSIPADLEPASIVAGELLISRNGCLQCHDRDTTRGLSAVASQIEAQRDDLRGQSQALIPPPLTAVGDRLRDEVLEAAIAGTSRQRRLPWLHVRMPAFRFTAEEVARVSRYLIASDRIPDSADKAREELFRNFDPAHPQAATPEELLTGNQLAGAGGFNCLACHKAGPFEPRNVAMGTRGSDIMQMGQRLRSRYFLRWMQNPIRIVPGVEMPAIRRAVPGVAGESLPAQIAVLWKALSDTRFTPPTVASRYEQLVTVAPGQSPRVIRDVFTLSGDRSGGSIARAFAAGFPNGHNVLLDLDTMSLQQWTFGEFARQRTEGKSWFWDMAGVPLLGELPKSPWCRLHEEGDASRTLELVPDQQRTGELLEWSVHDDSILLRMKFHFGASSKRIEQGPHDVIHAWNDPDAPLKAAVVSMAIEPATEGDQSGLTFQVVAEELPRGYQMSLPGWKSAEFHRNIPARAIVVPESGMLKQGDGASLLLVTAKLPVSSPVLPLPALISSADRLTVMPGFECLRQPLPASIMPTAVTVLDDGGVALTSLRGHVWIARDTDQDGQLDSASIFAEGLAAPYGIVADENSLLVSHKPEILRLEDTDADGRADRFNVMASGWGYSDDYHDWTTGLTRSKSGALYAGLGSDYSQNKRPEDNDRWRGTVLKIETNGTIEPVAYSLRFPMGLAFDRDEHLFVTDNQGVQNTFNELNMVIPGKHYGVPSRHERPLKEEAETPALMIPHPWTRSVNAIAFFPDDYPIVDLRGHGVGCEYDTRCLIRFTTQMVDGVMQGACYRLSRVSEKGGGENFVGPVACSFGKDGALWIGSIWDSGWQGGANTGCIEKIRPANTMPNGIREMRAVADGFEVTFFRAVEASGATDPSNWSLQGYTRKWQGSYATPDSDRHSLKINEIEAVKPETFLLRTESVKAGYVYELSVKESLDGSGRLWPAEAHYTMKKVPTR